VLLVHSPQQEQTFMAEGHGSDRRPVMYNDFVLVGPPHDPAGVRGSESARASFSRIAGTGQFVSRGDDSGTHVKEQEVWRLAGVEPRGDWYVRAGTGMAQVLRMAGEKRAYTLADRGTFLAQKAGLDLDLLYEGDPVLTNPYSVILVNPDKHPGVNARAARQFADFLLSAEARKVIEEFGKGKHGQPLFHAGSPGSR
jgi:tungstate transport system substrate-binding protein